MTMHMAGDGCPAAHGSHVGDLLVEIKVNALRRRTINNDKKIWNEKHKKKCQKHSFLIFYEIFDLGWKRFLFSEGKKWHSHWSSHFHWSGADNGLYY